jgi:hypothetical protein
MPRSRGTGEIPAGERLRSPGRPFSRYFPRSSTHESNRRPHPPRREALGAGVPPPHRAARAQDPQGDRRHQVVPRDRRRGSRPRKCASVPSSMPPGPASSGWLSWRRRWWNHFLFLEVGSKLRIGLRGSTRDASGASDTLR